MTKLNNEQIAQINRSVAQHPLTDWETKNVLDTVTDLQAQLKAQNDRAEASNESVLEDNERLIRELAASREEFRTTLATRDREIAMLYENQNASREKMECGHSKMFSKRVMRLPKYAAYPNFVETHYEDSWCVKSRCEPVYVCGCAGIHREDQPAHSNQLMIVCTLCAEIQAERAAVLEHVVDRIASFTGPHGGWTDGPKQFHAAILALETPTDRLALDRYVEEMVREGRLAEAEWWQQFAGLGMCERKCVGDELKLCPYCTRLAEIRASLPAAPPKENK